MADALNITIDEARGLVSDHALWPRVRDFLWDFATQIHPSWLEDIPGWGAMGAERGEEASAKRSASRLSSPRVKAYVLRQLGVKPLFYRFPKDDWSRLLLLDGETLLEIAKWLGAIRCADSLRRITDGATVRALKAALPGVYPEAFGYTMYCAGLGAGTAQTAADVIHAGLATLAGSLHSLPAEVVARLRFKLPKDLGDFCAPCDERKEKPAADNAVRKLLKLKFPEAYSLCC